MSDKPNLLRSSDWLAETEAALALLRAVMSKRDPEMTRCESECVSSAVRMLEIALDSKRRLSATDV